MTAPEASVMSVQHAWVLRFGELGLKSKAVRRGFQKTLRKNLTQLALDHKVPLVRGRKPHQDMVYSTAPVEDVEALHLHILDPLHHPLHTDAESWIER